MFNSRKPLRPTAAGPRRFRPTLELLDDRITPATFKVTLTTDTGLTNSLTLPLGPGTPGDLRNAIFQADQTPGTQNVIDLTGVSGTITLSAMLPPIFTTGSGSLLIVGSGASNLTISGNNLYRDFFITSGTVGIANLTIASGLAKGGNGGSGVAGAGGGGAGLGGGLLIDGTPGATTVTLTNVTFSGNQAIGGSGGNTSAVALGGGGGAGGNGGTGSSSLGGGGGFLGNGGTPAGFAGGSGGGGGGFTGMGGVAAAAGPGGNGADIGGGGGGATSGSGGNGASGGGAGTVNGSGGGGGGGGSVPGSFPGSSAGANASGVNGGDGGFGGGGGAGGNGLSSDSNGGNGGDYGGGGGDSFGGFGGTGGFGGGGGGGSTGTGGAGGFGGGGGGGATPGTGGTYGGNGDNARNGGGGAGLGGALFVRAGTVNLIDTTFTNNTATGGASGGGGATAGQGVGGAIFVMPTTGTVKEFSKGITAASSPADITVGPDGNLWFTEQAVDKIAMITPAGVVLTEFSAGITAGSGPLQITTGADGNLWFTEQNGSQIGRITIAGVVTEFPTLTPNSFPFGITSGPDLNLWFTEGVNKIGRITTGGVITEFTVPTPTNGGNGPGFIVTGPDGNLWFTENGNSLIGRITTAGVITEFGTGITAGSGPLGITAGPDGNLWFTEEDPVNGNRVGRITTAGAITEFSAGISSGSSPYDITAGPDGNLWFTEPGGNLIGRITTAGIVTEFVVPTAASNPLGITSGPGGALWFAEITGNKIGNIVAGANVTALGAAPTFTGNMAVDGSPNFFGTLPTDATATLTATAGTPQSAVVGTAFAVPLQATLKTGLGNPIVNAVLPFLAPPTGASATLSPLVGATNFSGQVSVNATANGTLGSYAVTAGGTMLKATFNLQNIAPPSVAIRPPYRVATGSTLGGFFSVFDNGRAILTNATAFAGYTGAVAVAVGDVNGDTVPDVAVIKASIGVSAFKVFDGATGTVLLDVPVFPATFGSSIALGDLDGDGKAEVIVGTSLNLGVRGSIAAVGVYDGKTGGLRSGFSAYPEAPTGVGVFVAAGDLDGDGKAEIITAPSSDAPLVRVFNGSGGFLRQFFAVPSTLGVATGSIAAGDLDGDGKAEILVGVTVGITDFAVVFNGATGKQTNLPLVPPKDVPRPAGQIGPQLTDADINGDGIPELLVTFGSNLNVYDGPTLALLQTLTTGPATTTGLYLG